MIQTSKKVILKHICRPLWRSKYGANTIFDILWISLKTWKIEEKIKKSCKSKILNFKESQENQLNVVGNTFIIFYKGIGFFYTKMAVLCALCVSVVTVFFEDTERQKVQCV